MMKARFVRAFLWVRVFCWGFGPCEIALLGSGFALKGELLFLRGQEK